MLPAQLKRILSYQISILIQPNHRAIVVQADVSDPNGPKALFNRAEETCNSLVHIFVNPAGFSVSKCSTISSLSVEDFDYIFNINAYGAFSCIQEASNRNARGGGGKIIAIESSLVGALRPNYTYTASKAAVETMTNILAEEMKGTRITTNCVAISTDMLLKGMSEEMIKRLADMNPMGRIGETKDVVPVVGFLCIDEGEWVGN